MSGGYSIRQNIPTVITSCWCVQSVVNLKLKMCNMTRRWTKITQENVDKVYELDDMGVPMMFAHVYDGVTTYGDIHRFGLSLGTMAKRGEYYYIELPRLHKVSYSNEK